MVWMEIRIDCQNCLQQKSSLARKALNSYDKPVFPVYLTVNLLSGSTSTIPRNKF